MEEFSKEEKEIWNKLDRIKVPEVGNLRPQFDQMMAEFQLKNQPKRSVFIHKWTKWAAAACILMAGTVGGVMIQKYVLNPKSDVEELSAEVHEMKQMMMLTLLENPTATERMRAVSLTEELPSVDEKVLKALFTTLNTDENENVRLVTLEALVQMADQPKVREGLVASILLQKSPLVQVALADAMVQIQEKKSVKTLKKLLLDQDLNQSVKEKYKKTIQTLV